MDYKTYLDLVLALENRQEPQSLQYLFRILDINNKGYLDTFCFNYFFRYIKRHNLFYIFYRCLKKNKFMLPAFISELFKNK